MKKTSIIILIGIFSILSLSGCNSQDTSYPDTTSPSSVSQQSQSHAESLPSQDATLPKIAIYNSTSYLLTDNDGAMITQDMLSEKIGESSDFIDFSGTVDESVLTKELANSISENAVFFKMLEYDDNFRIVAEDSGTYYILESTAMASSDVMGYIDLVSGGAVYDIAKTTEFAQITKEDTSALIDIFSNTAEAELTNEDYENIAQVQSDGNAYLLSVNFHDGTFTDMVVIPELNLVSIGQIYYTSETLGDDIGFVFDDLPQNTETPMN